MRILYVTTSSSFVNAFLIPHIEMLLEKKHTIDVATSKIVELNAEASSITNLKYEASFSRNPLSISNLSACRTIANILKENKYDVIHVHTPVAAFYTRIIALLFSNAQVFYTAHGFHFYKNSPLKNWILYFPMEKITSYFTHNLITLNSEDYRLAINKLSAKHTHIMHGVGVDLKKIASEQVDFRAKRNSLGVGSEDILLLSVGELNVNKNHFQVLRDIKSSELLNIKYIICGEGPLRDELESYVQKYGLDNNVTFLGRRSDIIEIMKVSDIFLHPSLREGLSKAIMEAMAVGLPVICSDIRGNRDLIDSMGGFLVNNKKDDYLSKINILVENKFIRQQMGAYNQTKIVKFDICNVLKELQKIYNFDYDD